MPFSFRKTVCYIKESSSRTPSITIVAEKVLQFANSCTSSALTILQSTVERTFYTNKNWHFKYSVSSMIKLFVVKCFRKLSYDKTISSLTEEEAILLSFLMKNGQIKLPSGGTLHHFVKYRLGEEGINEIMMLLGDQ